MVSIHGGDFAGCGEVHLLKWVKEKVADRYSTKALGLKGSDMDDDKESVILNRAVSWIEDGVALEASPRHVPLVLQELDMVELQREWRDGTTTRS